MSTPVFVFSEHYEADIGPHVFPVVKYRRVRDMLLASGWVTREMIAEPRDYGREPAALVHTPEYLEDLFALRDSPATLSSELPLTEEIVRWFLTAVHGTMTATDLALANGAAFHIGGGFHHAFADHAEGFCYLNDVAVAARLALEEHAVERVAVVDLDVHQGNGTAHIFQEEPRVFTFSMHQENNYPVKRLGDLDIGLPDHVGDEVYLDLLDRGLRRALDEFEPRLVYYVAGADPYEEDVLGGLALTLDGLRERDRRVFEACCRVGAKVVVVLAGGYARQPEDTALIHYHTAQEMMVLGPCENTVAPPAS